MRCNAASATPVLMANATEPEPRAPKMWILSDGLGFASILGCRPAAILYVGNEQADVETAKAAGCRAVVIDRADQRPAWGQDRVVGSLMELWVEHSWF